MQVSLWCGLCTRVYLCICTRAEGYRTTTKPSSPSVSSSPRSHVHTYTLPFCGYDFSREAGDNVQYIWSYYSVAELKKMMDAFDAWEGRGRAWAFDFREQWVPPEGTGTPPPPPPLSEQAAAPGDII
mgnify:CR=1 FL=1